MNAKIKEIQSLRDAALEDLLCMSDEELRLDAGASGFDLDTLAKEAKAIMREAAAEALRERMKKARAAPPVFSNKVSNPAFRPSIEAIKEMIQSLFARNPSVGLAFRDGKRQSESDWQSLYDDLINLGVLKRSDDER